MMVKIIVTVKITAGSHLEVTFQEEGFYFAITKTGKDTKNSNRREKTFQFNTTSDLIFVRRVLIKRSNKPGGVYAAPKAEKIIQNIIESYKI